MNRKGIFIMSDMFWFVLFIFFAAMTFFALHVLSGGIKNTIELTNLEKQDADFIATTLPRMTDARGITFSKIIQDYAHVRLTTTDIKTTQEYNDYKLFVDLAIGPITLTQPGGYFPKPKAEQNLPIQYAVALSDAQGLWKESCQAYPETSSLCSRIMEEDLGETWITENIHKSKSYIPTNEGPITLTVVVKYEEK